MRRYDAEIEIGLTRQGGSWTIATRLYRARQDLRVDLGGMQQQAGCSNKDKHGARRPCSL